MSAHDFWMNVLAHFVAIVLGGVKLAIISGVFWYVWRKKYMAKFMGKLFQDLQAQMNPPAPVGSPVAVAAFDPASGFGNAPPLPPQLCQDCYGSGLARPPKCPSCGGTGKPPATIPASYIKCGVQVEPPNNLCERHG